MPKSEITFGTTSVIDTIGVKTTAGIAMTGLGQLSAPTVPTVLGQSSGGFIVAGSWPSGVDIVITYLTTPGVNANATGETAQLTIATATFVSGSFNSVLVTFLTWPITAGSANVYCGGHGSTMYLVTTLSPVAYGTGSVLITAVPTSGTTSPGSTNTSWSHGLSLSYSLDNGSSQTTPVVWNGTLGTFGPGNGGIPSASPTLIALGNGQYQICYPNVALGTTGATGVDFVLSGVNSMQALTWHIDLLRVNFQDGVRGGMTAIPNAMSGTPPGLALAQQVSNIAVTSAALNAIAASSTYTTGSSVGGFANTATVDGVYDVVSPAAGTIDCYYQFNVSGTSGAVGVGANWTGYLTGYTGTTLVYAFNWGGSAWDQIGTIVGLLSTSTNQTEEWELTSAHTGTGGNAGLVRIRFSATGATGATLNTDRILLGYAVVPPTAAAIATGVWQDTTAGDFNIASSIGKSLYTSGSVPGASGGLFIAGSNAATTVNITGTLSTVTTVTNQLAASTIATAIWQDTTAGDFNIASSIGKSLYTSGVVPGGVGGLFIAGSNAATSVNITGNITGNLIGTVSTTTTVTNQLTAAQIATGVWQDATAGDFTISSSIGKSLYTGGNAPGAASGLAIVGSNVTFASGTDFSATMKASFPSGFNTLTTATIATAVNTDTVAGDYAVAGSPFGILRQLLGTFTTNTSSVFTVSALANGPAGGGGGSGNVTGIDGQTVTAATPVVFPPFIGTSTYSPRHRSKG